MSARKSNPLNGGLPGDQADGLRRMGSKRPVKVITVTGGKGGVGKSSICANLGVAMAMMGRRVMLLDGDLGLANIDVMFGLHPQNTLADLVHDQVPLEDVVVTGPENIMVVPGASGLSSMSDLSPAHHIGIVNAFSSLTMDIDTLLVDTAAGIGDDALRFCEAAHEVIVVVCDEVTSITDSYAIIKVLSTERNVSKFRVVTNMTRDGGSGRELFEKLERVTGRFLDVTLDHAGSIPYDDRVWRSVQKQVPLVTAYPGALASQSMKRLAMAVDRWKPPEEARGNIEFFVDRLLRGENARETATA